VKALVYILALLMVADGILSSYIALRAPYPAAVPLGSPMAYRNVYLHVPIAWATYVLFIIAFILSILYLVTQDKKYDKYAALFVYTALVYAFMVLATGSAWAQESWGSFWNWDPRETGVLILFIAYLVYVAIRKSVQDPDRRATISAVYSIAAFATVPISFIMPYVMEGSLHPTLQATKGFITQPQVSKFFFAKVLLTVIEAVLIPVVVGMGYSREFFKAAVATAAILLVGAALAYPWGLTGRVVEAKLQSGTAELTAIYKGEKIKIKGSLELVINNNGQKIKVVVKDTEGLPKPEFVTVPGFAKGSNLTVNYEGRELWPTALGHLVKVENERAVALNPFCIPWTLFIYAIGFLILAYVLPREIAY